MTSLRTFLTFVACLLFTALPAKAQSSTEPALALQGTDVVSYFKAGGPVTGQAALRHDFDGAHCLFSSAKNRAAFMADPDSDSDLYLPQFAGLCTTGLSKGFIGESDPNVWKIVDGRLCLFSTAERMPADVQAPETIARATESWAKRK